MTIDEPTPSSRQARLVARRRRQRWAAILVVALTLGAAGTVAAFAFTDDAPATSSPELLTGQSVPARTGVDTTSTTAPTVNIRPINHDAPLRLWIGGDSLSGTTGLALGRLASTTGVVATHVDYKVSSGLNPGPRDWQDHAETAIAERDPEAVVFIIGTNDANAVNSQDGNDDGVPDWEVDYRKRVAAMMDLLVGGEKQRTVIWVGAPTMKDDERDKDVVEINRVMAEEAAKRAPNVIYLDAYALFSDEDGEYTDRIDVPVDTEGDAGTESAENESAESESVRVRIGDGVHFTEAGAQYLARNVFALLDQRYRIGAQADPTRPINGTLEEGGEIGGSTGRDDDDNSSNNRGTTPTTRRRSGNTGNQSGTPTTSAPSDSGEDDAPPPTDAPAPTQPPATQPPVTQPTPSPSP
jgi:hypothetical protein